MERKKCYCTARIYGESIRPRNVDRCSSNVNTERSDLVSIRIAVLNHDFVLLLLGGVVVAAVFLTHFSH